MNTSVAREAITARNANRLLWAGSVGIFAAGAGFAIRGGILHDWGAEFGFNATQLGAISGAGFSGFCFGIIAGGLVCDRIGYGNLVALAFALHVLSACVTFVASGPSAYVGLYWGMLIFGYANGTLESVANPLVATLFPVNRAHFLNVLHASWPASLAVGGIIGWVLDDRLHLDWRLQLSIYLFPTVLYGLLFFRQPMPKSDAYRQGLRLGEMLKDIGLLGALVVCGLFVLFLRDALNLPGCLANTLGALALVAVGLATRWALGSVLLLVLLTTQALVSAVELGTDGWIQNITGNLLTSEQGKFLFVATSVTMFALRFCVNPIERYLKLSPIGLLVGCALMACLGLSLTSTITTIEGGLAALLVYASGKSLFWPTMLAIVSDRFPRAGAIAIAMVGGIGFMSAGLIGAPGLGYAKDRFAGEALHQAGTSVFEAYRSDAASRFLFFEPAYGFNGRKLADVQAIFSQAKAKSSQSGRVDRQDALIRLTEPQLAVYQASITGDRKTLRIDALIPAVMAVIYVLLLMYFKLIGGYRPAPIQS